MSNLIVTFHSGKTRTVPADRYDSQGDYWRFSLNGEETDLITKKSVESITTKEAPEEHKPAPKMGAV